METNAAYEEVTEDLQNKSSEFLDLYAKANPIPNARAKVPLLVVSNQQGGNDDLHLCESLVVTEYIAETCGNKDDKECLIPSDPTDRATMRLFFELCGGTFSKYFPILRSLDNNDESYLSAVTALKDGMVETNAFLERCSSDGPFLLGERFSLAECNMAPFVQRCCAILPEFTSSAASGKLVDPIQICDDLSLNRLKEWIVAVLDRPSVKTTGVPKPKLIESSKRMLERFADMEKQKNEKKQKL